MKNKFLLKLIIFLLLIETQSFKIGETEINKSHALAFLGGSLVVGGFLLHNRRKCIELKDKLNLEIAKNKNLNCEIEKNKEKLNEQNSNFLILQKKYSQTESELKDKILEKSALSLYLENKDRSESKNLIDRLRKEMAYIFYLDKEIEKKENFGDRIKSVISYMRENGGFEKEVLDKALEEKVWKKKDKGLSESLLQYSDIRAEISNENEDDIPRFYEQDCYLIALAFIENFLNKSGKEVLESKLFKELIFQAKTVELPYLFQVEKSEKNEGKIFEIKDRSKNDSFEDFLEFFKEKGIYLVLRNRKINGHLSDGHYYVVKNDGSLIKAYNERFSEEACEKVLNNPINLDELVFKTNKKKGNYFLNDENAVKEEMQFKVFKIKEEDLKYLLDANNYEF